MWAQKAQAGEKQGNLLPCKSCEPAHGSQCPPRCSQYLCSRRTQGTWLCDCAIPETGARRLFWESPSMGPWSLGSAGLCEFVCGIPRVGVVLCGLA